MPNRPHNADHAVIHLDGDQAVLLFEYLWESLSGDGRPVEQTAEVAVLNHVLCQLEEQLVAPFRDDYADLLSSARARLKPAG
ncbi:hypothetical protein EV560_105434 [Bosea sp. BK604]|nr:hypothetical protein EV560_105434 [Bosea sp. BK604]